MEMKESDFQKSMMKFFVTVLGDLEKLASVLN